MRGFSAGEGTCLRKGRTLSRLVSGAIASTGTSANHHDGLNLSYTCAAAQRTRVLSDRMRLHRVAAALQRARQHSSRLKRTLTHGHVLAALRRTK